MLPPLLYRAAVTCGAALLVIACAPVTVLPESAVPREAADKLLVVDCLLPGQIRKLGTGLTYLAPRRPIKTTAADCEIRGGEYVAYDRANYATALKVWLPQAQGGDAEAQAYVGEIYEKGLGLEPDYALAAQWYRKAADQGNSRAMVNLGNLYEQGLGVPRDRAEALNWYRRASGLTGDQLAFASSVQELQQEAESLRQEVVASRQQVALTQQENAALRRQLDQSQSRLQAQSARVVEAQRQRDATLAELRRKSQQIAAAAPARPATPPARPATPTPPPRVTAPTPPPRPAAPTPPPVDTAEIERLKRQLVEQQRQVEEQRRQALALQEQTNQQRAQLGLELVALQQEWDRQSQAASQRQQELERELALRNQEVGSLRDQLDSAERQLSERNQLLTDAEAQREEIRQALDRARSQQTSGDAAAQAQAQAQVQELEQRLARQQAVIDEQNQAMEYLQQESERRFAQLTAEVRATQERARELESESAFQARENQSLQQQVTYLQRQWESSQDRLNERQQALEAQRQALDEARQEQARRQAELERQIQQATSANQEQIDALQREVQEREAQLRQREVDLRRTQRQVDDLQFQVTQREDELRQIENQQQQVALAGPTIEILDPPVTLTRGSEGVVTLQSPVDQREIVGRVQAPNGLFLLTVNDQRHTVDENGLFRAQVPVSSPDNPVSITAVDDLGQRASIAFSLKANFRSVEPATAVAQEAAPAPQPVPTRTRPQVEFGRYYALVIGNNRYQDFPDLQTAVNDAEAIAGLLRRRYGFETRVLIDADRYSILSALNEFRSKLTDQDNFLLYYAGHGELDQGNENGNWLPVDAEPESTANWISNGQITDILNAMTAKHVMVIADSCYSGTLARSVTTSTEGGRSDEEVLEWLQVMVNVRSRTVITSGGVKPVLDGGGGDHSLFAKYLLEALERNQGVLEGPKLYLAVAGQVKRRARQLNVEQDPLYAPIPYAGDEGAPFFFNVVN